MDADQLLEPWKMSGLGETKLSSWQWRRSCGQHGEIGREVLAGRQLCIRRTASTRKAARDDRHVLFRWGKYFLSH